MPLEYQLCPKCNGQGIVSKPPYVPNGVSEWTSNQSSYVCDVCNGAKIIPRPVCFDGWELKGRKFRKINKIFNDKLEFKDGKDR